MDEWSKHARHNLCFSENAQEPNYEQGKGRGVVWENVPLLSTFKKNLGKYFRGSEELAAE